MEPEPPFFCLEPEPPKFVRSRSRLRTSDFWCRLKKWRLRNTVFIMSHCLHISFSSGLSLVIALLKDLKLQNIERSCSAKKTQLRLYAYSDWFKLRNDGLGRSSRGKLSNKYRKKCKKICNNGKFIQFLK